MKFIDELEKYKDFDVDAFFDNLTQADVFSVLAKPRLDCFDYLTLLSPLAAKYLEPMAERAQRDTIRNFGYTIQLFTPMYIANYCENLCVYCGFNHENKIYRHQLSIDEIHKEGELIAKSGLKHVLVLTGESPKYSSVDYILDAVKVLNKMFTSVSIEVYSFTQEDYVRAVTAGVDGMTMFQEVYNKDVYKMLHLSGPKSVYEYRLDAPERACRAGMRNVNIGALLGLDKWRREAFFTGVHADYLQHKYKDVEIAVSMPRMRPCAAGFPPRDIVNDADIVQYIMAYRIFMPHSGITVSTRERRSMRDHLVHLGVTKMSGGVTTAVGGHSKGETASQFDISDTRSVAEMAKMIYNEGYQPVYKDWQALAQE
jgi:2-iminoacetate synthase